MNIFISHQKNDAGIAKTIHEVLKNKYGVESYLDVLDKNVPITNSEALTKHIKNNLLQCTDILVLMTLNTKDSWWVPFEIGVAEGHDIPVVTYLSISEKLPEYLDFWPRIGTLPQLGKYVASARKRLKKQEHLLEQDMEGADAISMEDSYIHFSQKEQSLTQEFYTDLKRQLQG